MEFLASTTSTILFATGLVLAIVILLRRAHGYFGRRPKQLSPIQKVARPDPTPGRTTMIEDRALVQMHETVRELSAKIDSKMIALEQLIRAAHEVCSRLEATLNRAESQRE